MKEHNVQKVIPDERTFQHTFLHHVRAELTRLRTGDVMRKIADEVDEEMMGFKPPKGLQRKVARQFHRNATLSWRDAIRAEEFSRRKAK